MEVKDIAIGGLRSAFRVFEQDLQALPDEAFNKSFGGKARTVCDIVHEVNLVNDHMLLALRGEPTPEWPDGWVTAPENVRTKEAAIQAFQETCARVLATAEEFSEADLSEKIATERGDKTRFERCQFMALHLWYHSGQLNYVQTLLGDDGWHWS